MIIGRHTVVDGEGRGEVILSIEGISEGSSAKI